MVRKGVKLLATMAVKEKGENGEVQKNVTKCDEEYSLNFLGFC
jgi:hypothetical protein